MADEKVTKDDEIPVTPKEAAALDRVEAALTTLNDASRPLGVRTKRDAKSLDPFADLCGSPAIDGVVIGKPILKEGELASLIGRVRSAKTSRERLYEVVAILAKMGATAVKGLA